jgi:hypothetical protein
MDEITTAVGATGWLQVWDGALPATPATAPAGTLLASLAMSNPIAPAASGGVLTLSAITDDTNANATGTPTFARFATSETGTTTGIVQMSAAVGSGDLNFDASIVSAGTVAVSSLTITEGN